MGIAKKVPIHLAQRDSICAFHLLEVLPVNGEAAREEKEEGREEEL